MVDTALNTHPEAGAAGRVAGQSIGATRRRLQPGTAWLLSSLTVDASMLAIAAAGTALGGAAAGISSPSAMWMAIFGVLCVAMYAKRGLYAPRLRLRAIDDVSTMVVATTIAAMVVLSLRALVGDVDDVLADSLRPWAFAVVYVAAGRVALYWSQAKAREQGAGVKRTLIVGAGRVGSLVAKRLLDNPDLGLRPVAFLDKEPLTDTQRTLGLPVAGASWDLDDALERFGAEQVIVTFSTAPEEVLLRLVRRCEERGVAVAIVPRLFERMPEQLTIDHLGGLPLITPHRTDPKDWQFDVKHALDRVMAGIGLLLLSPLFLVAMLAVRLTMGRPVFFRQPRVGRDGRSFEMLKFRSMMGGGEAGGGEAGGGEAGDGEAGAPVDLAPGGVEGDDRRTRLGSILRRTSIDELPQLMNVLRGEMSLVGPRPERPEFVSHFEQSVYRYTDRHRVKSGITGWAQVNGLRGKTSIADRAEWDNFYIENFSLRLDAKILLQTAGALLANFRDVE